MKTASKISIKIVWLFALIFGLTATESEAQRITSFAATAVAKPMVARHGLTSTKYQQEFTKWANKGYRINHISGYEVSGNARYAAIWIKETGPALKAHHGLSSAQYQQKVTQYVGQGYRIKQVSGYDVKGKAYFAAIFEKKSGPAWVAKHNLTAASYQTEFTKWTGKGYRLTCVSGYAISGKARYAAVWVKQSGPQWKTHHGMTSATYQQKFNTYRNQGYRLSYISAYRVGNTDRYAAIWEKKSGKAWSARHRMNSQNYQNTVDNFHYQGYRLLKVTGYNIGGKARYAAIWEEGAFKASDIAKIDQRVKAFMNKYNVPGLQFAVAKNEKLVFAKGYGKADKEKGIVMGPKTLGRIASISKPITSAAILKLDAQKANFSYNSKVFGPGSIFGTSLGTKGYSVKETNIRIKNLLEHTAGANNWDNNTSKDHSNSSPKAAESPKTGDPMFSKSSFNHNQLIGWALDDRTPDYSPGTYYAYSNLGYCVLGRVVEKLTNQNYDTWVKNNILKQCGITDMHIGGDTKAQKRWNEMVYYGQGGDDPYKWKVKRMDSHGGWIANSIDLLRFATRVDGKSGKKDIISASSYNTMLKQHSYAANPVNKSNSYMKGWSKGSTGVSHGGSLPGTYSRLVIYNDGWSYSLLVNTKSKDDKFGSDFGKLVKGIINDIMKKTTIPSKDLF